MKKLLIYCLFALFAFGTITANPVDFSNDAFKQVPTAYKGRFRPLDTQARLWLYDFYHSEHIKRADQAAFDLPNDSAYAFMWNLHFLGHEHYNQAPLFWTDNSALKQLLNLSETSNRFSYNALHNAIYENKTSNLNLMKFLLSYQFIKQYRDSANRSKSEKQELSSLARGLWVRLNNNSLIIAATPESSPWNFLKAGQIISENYSAFPENYAKSQQNLNEEILRLLSLLQKFESLTKNPANEEAYKTQLQILKSQGLSPREISQSLEAQFPLNQRLAKADDLIRVLPGKFSTGEWLPLKALNIQTYDPATNELTPVANFTLYSNTLFNELRETYNQLIKTSDKEKINALTQQLTDQLQQGYSSLAGTPYKAAIGKKLYYPTPYQLKAEFFYYKAPLTALTIALYGIGLALFAYAVWAQKKRASIAAIGLVILAFLLHTFVLILRCYILQRPPVSNMFETIVYVPWIAVLTGFILAGIFQRILPLIASTLAALSLLIILEATGLNNSLENVQAVLDSQYWLIIHVLLVVGSYGAFLLCGIFGHFYLGSFAIQKKETPNCQFIGSLIVQTMYLGLAMLIPGTILGGVWAAESWGRFWDWDPKESWAFISICTYLIWVHAYRFGHIRYFGLAIGSVIGLQIISFTWYGVNYILGTGLHSYGFGAGGELYYYLFIGMEAIFLFFVWQRKKAIDKKNFKANPAE